MGECKIELIQSAPLAAFSALSAFQISADILLIINSSPGNLSERSPSQRVGVCFAKLSLALCYVSESTRSDNYAMYYVLAQ